MTAHFPRAVSVYEGTDVRILGVNVGTVTAVIPEGNSVRVEIEYDAEYQVPAEATAAIVTPTLVADRFVQLDPAYTGGRRARGRRRHRAGRHRRPGRARPHLRQPARPHPALGPNGVNADGTLDHTLRGRRDALEGNGALGNEMLRNLSEAATTFGEGSGDLFETVSQLAEFTDALAEQRRGWSAPSSRDLAGMSRSAWSPSAPSCSRRCRRSLARSARSKTFVQDNRKALVTDVEKLTRVDEDDQLRARLASTTR